MSSSDMIIRRQTYRRQKRDYLSSGLCHLASVIWPLSIITLKCVLILLLSFVLYYAFLINRDSIGHLFPVSFVEVSGLNRLERREIIDLSRLESKTSLLSVDLEEIYRKVKDNPWVGDILIRKEFPARIIIKISEREPVARVMIKDDIYLVDNEGVALKKFDWIYDSLPLIKGREGVEIIPGKRMDWGGAREGLEIIKLLSSRTKSGNHNNPDNIIVDVSKRRDLKIYLQGYLLRFGRDNMEEKLDRFFMVEEDLKNRFAEPIEIDLRFPKRVIVRPQMEGKEEIG